MNVVVQLVAMVLTEHIGFEILEEGRATDLKPKSGASGLHLQGEGLLVKVVVSLVRRFSLPSYLRC